MLHHFIETLNNIIFFYAVTISIAYVLLAIFSARALNHYMKKNKFVDYNNILTSPLSPSVSLIAPAYNEEKNIVENIRSLLSVHYNNIEIIIVNDGSKDNTMQAMIDAYHLQKVDYYVNIQVPCKEILGVYKSSNKAFKKLVVVDKENGGKSDALNAGINVAENELITCIDVDCIVEQGAILKMVKPFMEEDKKVIATGGVIRIANSCVIEDGRLIDIKVPEKIIPRFQVVEYIRAFLLGRMAWSKLNGLLLISGALGLFDKRIVIECGGYEHKTVGEDMELVVRMRRYMTDNKRKYKVVYIPDPLCWTEAPDDYKILARQRNRWMRGTIETLWFHRKIFFNPKYGLLGVLSYPFWFFYEWLAPIVEFLGLLYFIFLISIGYSNWVFFLLLFFTVYFFAITISILSLVYEEFSYRQYKKHSEILKLIGTLVLEPLIYHPRTVWWSLRGNIDKIRGRKSWGDMSRKGFDKKIVKNETGN
ncbi:MAG: glycosyltransferase [Bacteroidia bacterium]|nr:glycosyltransferase [Bacteroidia bacterium]MCZ2140338.1 glycosyltransferase [Bacteroidia bacterium]